MAPAARALRRSWLLASWADRSSTAPATACACSSCCALDDDALIEALAAGAAELRERITRFTPRGDAGAATWSVSAATALATRSGAARAGRAALLTLLGGGGASSARRGAGGGDRGQRRGERLWRRGASEPRARPGDERGHGDRGLTDGIAAAAHTGALERVARAWRHGRRARRGVPGAQALAVRVLPERGCAVSELPTGCAGRRWGQLASVRIAVELASVTVLVEAEDTPGGLAGARLAQALGRTLAAIPGRICSPPSRGTTRSCWRGASLVRGARDVLELLGRARRSGSAPARASCGAAGQRPARRAHAGAARATFERVGAGATRPIGSRARARARRLCSSPDRAGAVGAGDPRRRGPLRAL